MPDLINCDQAFISAAGNFSLGDGGLDDKQGDATFPWAKTDCWIHIDPVIDIPAAAPTASLTEANVRASAGRWNRTYTSSGTPSAFIYIPFRTIYRTLASTTLLDPKTPAGNHGFKVNSMVMAYGVTVATMTSVTVAFQRAVAFLDAAAIPAVNTTPLGATIAYQEPPGTSATALPTNTSGTPYLVAAVPNAPVFITTVRDAINCEVNIQMISPGVFTLYDIWFNLSVALY